VETTKRIAFPAILLTIVLGITSALSGQSDPDADYKAEKSRAISLFGENRLLEALPIFEDLVGKNPSDDKVLLGLAACLVNHSAAVTDPDAAGKERQRALELLKKAQTLGNNSQLLQNLLQILQAAPASGHIKYSENTSVDEAMRAGETAFARRDYDEAIKSYSHALELDPKNATAALFVGDSYYAKKDFANAGGWYGRASVIDPNLETPYRYYADMLTQQGDMPAARAKAIQAVVAEPYNPITWRGLAQWATANHLSLNRVFIQVPSNVAKNGEAKVVISVPAGPPTDASAAWLAYSLEKALWQGEKFKKQFPQESQFRHSLREETAALTVAAKVWTELEAKHASAESPDANLDLLLKLYRTKLIEPYVLLNAADEGVAKDYAEYRETHRPQLEQYLSEFVVPPAPSKPSTAPVTQ
jgi:tetratricopeptide (TPR) repeat protein